MKALIPVAGIGTRLRPITYTVPKALIRVAGKPILGHIVDTLIESGIDAICFITGYMEDRIRDWAENTYDIPMEWVTQRETLGLGHAVLQAERVIAGEPIFIVLGDTVFEADIASVIEKGGNSLGVMEVEDPTRFGVVVVEGERVIKLVEKPDQPISYLAIAGLYHIIDTDLLLDSLNRLVEENIKTRGEYQLTDALSMMLGKDAVFRIFPLQSWYDCGVPAAVLATNRSLLDKMPAVDTFSGDNVIIIPPVHIGEGAVIESSVVGPHVTLDSDANVKGSVIRDSIIGHNSLVEGAILERSILGGNSNVRGRPMVINIGDSATVDIE